MEKQIKKIKSISYDLGFIFGTAGAMIINALAKKFEPLSHININIIFIAIIAILIIKITYNVNKR